MVYTAWIPNVFQLYSDECRWHGMRLARTMSIMKINYYYTAMLSSFMHLPAKLIHQMETCVTIATQPILSI